MKRLVIVLVTILILAYPFAVYFGLSYLSPRYIALGLISVFLLRLILVAPGSTADISKRGKTPWLGISTIRHVILATIVGVIVSLVSIVSNQILAMKLYPVAINLLMFIVFFYSLIYPPTVVTRLANIKCRELSRAAIKYTTKVTFVWCIFFIINGAIALWTALFSTFKFWTFYNGFLSYILIGALFVTEFTYRQWVKRRNHL